MSTSSAARPNTTFAPHAPSDSVHGLREWDGDTTNLSESPLVTSDHPDREQLEELAFSMFHHIDRALNAAIGEDWEAVALWLVTALEMTNEMRAILGTDESEPE